MSRRLRWGFVVAWATLIFAVSATPGSALPGGYSVEAHLVEYGHKIVPRRSKAVLSAGRKSIAKRGATGMVAPKPFIRPAASRAEAAVPGIVVEHLRSELIRRTGG